MLARRKQDRQKRRRLRAQPISRIFPNIITLAGLCCGLSSIRFALNDRMELAVAFIIAAAIIDGMDGRVARMLGATSEFGAQLDSLSDFVCFGVAPVLVLYIWQLDALGGFGWAVVLFFAMCAALRLARFNTMLLEDSIQPWKKEFFVGVPSPAGAILCLLPLIVHLQLGQDFSVPNAVIALHIVLVGALMASRIPTFSGKNIRITHEYLPHFMVGVSFVLVLFVIELWAALSIVAMLYILTIPLSAYRWKQRLREEGVSHDESLSEE